MNTTQPKTTRPRDLNTTELRTVGGGAAFLKLGDVKGECQMATKLPDVLISSYQAGGHSGT